MILVIITALLSVFSGIFAKRRPEKDRLLQMAGAVLMGCVAIADTFFPQLFFASPTELVSSGEPLSITYNQHSMSVRNYAVVTGALLFMSGYILMVLKDRKVSEPTRQP